MGTRIESLCFGSRFELDRTFLEKEQRDFQADRQQQKFRSAQLYTPKNQGGYWNLFVTFGCEK